jgi:hypothetical protein
MGARVPPVACRGASQGTQPSVCPLPLDKRAAFAPLTAAFAPHPLTRSPAPPAPALPDPLQGAVRGGHPRGTPGHAADVRRRAGPPHGGVPPHWGPPPAHLLRMVSGAAALRAAGPDGAARQRSAVLAAAPRTPARPLLPPSQPLQGLRGDVAGAAGRGTHRALRLGEARGASFLPGGLGPAPQQESALWHVAHQLQLPEGHDCGWHLLCWASVFIPHGHGHSSTSSSSSSSSSSRRSSTGRAAAAGP